MPSCDLTTLNLHSRYTRMTNSIKPQNEQDTLVTEVERLKIEGGAVELVEQCRKLLEEIDTFEAYLTSHGHSVELRHFRGSVKNEYKLLEKVCPLCGFKIMRF